MNEPVNILSTVAFKCMTFLAGMMQVIVHAWASTIEIFIRRRFGVRYFGFAELLGWVLMILYAINVAPEPYTRPYDFLVYLLPAMWIGHQAAAKVWARSPNAPDAQYSGKPLLCYLLPFVPEASVKRLLEPMLVVAIGVGIYQYHPSFGVYVAIAGCCLAADEALGRVVGRIEARATAGQLIVLQH